MAKIKVYSSNIDAVEYLGDGKIKVYFIKGAEYIYYATEEIWNEIGNSSDVPKKIRDLLINDKSIKFAKQ